MTEPGKIILPVNDGSGINNDPIIPIEGSKGDEFTSLVVDNTTYKVNKDGNAVDDAGTVIKTKEELAQLQKPVVTTEEPKSIEVEAEDGTKTVYKLDDKGNALNTDGTIFKTKEEIDALSTPDDEDVVSIEGLQKLTNIIPVDSEGKPIVYEDSSEGLSKYVLDAGATLGEQIAKQEQQKLISTYPILQDVITHLVANNGSLEGFNEKVDWGSIQLDEKNETQLKDVVIRACLAKGMPQADAERFAEYSKSDGKLKEDGKTSLEYLVSKQNEQRDIAAQQNKAIEKKRIEEEIAYWTSIKETLLTKGKLQIGEKTINIPKVIKVNEGGKTVLYSPEQVWDFIYKPKVYDINGQKVELTPNQYKMYIERNSRKVDDDIFDAIKRLTNYNLEQFIEEQTNAHIVKKIRLSKAADSKSNTKINVGDGKGKNIVMVVK